jgi:hypothetical protein
VRQPAQLVVLGQIANFFAKKLSEKISTKIEK